MPKTFLDGREVKKWYQDGRKVKKAFLDGRQVFQDEFVLNLNWHDHNIGLDWAWNHLPLDVRNDQTQAVRIIIHSGIQLVTANTGIRGVFDFYGGWGARQIILENYGYILGRGGNGGNVQYGTPQHENGFEGGRAIYNESVELTIYNHGVIAGGGGGGAGLACRRSGSSSNCCWGGGGGAPFGTGGWVSNGKYQLAGYNAGFDYSGGAIIDPSGNSGGGGMWGGRGGDTSPNSATGSYYGRTGGAAGEASRGGINWAVLGDVRGARV